MPATREGADASEDARSASTPGTSRRSSGSPLVAALVGGYILHNQRMRFPWEGKPFQLQAAFSTAQAVTPGQGQTVRVSGVRVGDITKVGLKDGHAVVTLDLDPEYKDLVHTDATALLRPKTGLKDMFIELDPGTRRGAAGQARAGRCRSPTRCPTSTPTRSSPRWTPTRATTSRCSSTAPGAGLKGRGNDLREVFRRFEPTHRDLARVNGLVAQRHQNLQPARALARRPQRRAGRQERRPRRPGRLVLAPSSAPSPPSRPTSRRAVGDLPGALRQTTDTLGRSRRFAETLRPAADAPAARAEGAQPRQRRRAALRQGGGADRPRARSGPSCATRGRSCARRRKPANELAAADARPDELVHRAQPPLQPRRLQPQRAARTRARTAARRATCSGSRGCSTTAPRCSRPPTPTGPSAR